MAPFTIETLERYPNGEPFMYKRPWDGKPLDIHDIKGSTGVAIYPLEDPEQVQVGIQGQSKCFASGEGGVIMPGQKPEASVVNRRSIDIFDARKISRGEAPEPVARIIHREPEK